MKASLVSIFLIFSIHSKAQLETKWWYFGGAAGVEFQENQVIGDTSSNACVQCIVSGAVQSSNEGELLFYHLNDTIWNRNHDTLLNGTGLIVATAEQNAVIVPYPEHDSLYFLFNTDIAQFVSGGLPDSGLFYHLIDMKLDGGLGGVVDSVKNVVLIDSTAEKIAATVHANGKDYWVVVQQGGTNNYHAFLVDENGVNPTPVTTSIGMIASNYGLCEGTLKFNHGANMLVNKMSVHLMIMDFDNATGQLSNLKMLNNIAGGYGAEFSPDDTKLYTGGPLQFDVTLPTATEIQNSSVNLSFVTQGSQTLTNGLQLGLDGRIYGINWEFTPNGYLTRINFPNESGAACGYQDSAVSLLGRVGNESLPSFLSSYFKTNFTTNTLCVGDTTFFDVNYHFIDSVLWDFGDPASGAANTSTIVDASHVYSGPGSYTVTLIAKNGAVIDTVIRTIEVGIAPSVALTSDLELCFTSNDSVLLQNLANSSPADYLWSTGSTDSSIFVDANLVTSSGVEMRLDVWLALTNTCGSDTDTVTLTASRPLSVSLPPDTVICQDSFLLSASIENLNSFTSIVWREDATLMQSDSVSIGVVSPLLGGGQGVGQKTFEVLATNACNTDSASTTLTWPPSPDGFLPNDSLYCGDEPFALLHSNTNGVEYRWHTGNSENFYIVRKDDTVSLSSFTVCDTLRDTVRIRFNHRPRIELGNDSAVCPGEVVTLKNHAEVIYPQTYLWSTGNTDSILIAKDTGLFIVTVTLDQCSQRDSIWLRARGDCYPRCIPGPPNVITPNGDGLNDVFGAFMECNTQNFNLEIYNRWGQPVFISQHPFDRWDGTTNGELAGEGAYFYRLEFVDENDEAQAFRGVFTLLR